ncbi:MAG: phospholipase D-like domain-containing protein [Thermodesulfobacteriota bacterium]
MTFSSLPVVELFITILSVFLFGWFIATLLGCRRSMPTGLSFASPLLPAGKLLFLSDLTFLKKGELYSEQKIFPEVLRLISEAESFIILDVFLYNDLHNAKEVFPQHSKKITQALLAAKALKPSLHVWIISDPANTGYGSYTNPYFQKLKDAGARVVLTNLDRLPDSNLAYSPFWNLLCRPFGSGGKGWLPSPFYPQSPPFTLRGWLTLFNFKANHRKLLITEKEALITSANNSHDASAANSNIAFCVSGPLLCHLIKSEQAVTALSGVNINVTPPEVDSPSKNDQYVQLLTEGKIKKILLEDLQKCQDRATIWMAMFYLADHQIIAALLAAALRGATINLILDANRDAFGHQKKGVPNRPVAALLKRKGGERLQIRWYDSHGEQFHSKLVMITDSENTSIIGGSANLTRRNICDYNLETSLRIVCPTQSPVSREVHSYFHGLWENKGGHFTVDYEQFADTSILKYWQYELQERFGFSLF